MDGGLVVYVFAVAAAAIVAAGEAVQQRLAAAAPPSDAMSWRLLLWLVRRPRWLAGVGASLAGNILFALAVGAANVVRTEAVFVVRLLFGLLIAAALRRCMLPLRDTIGGMLVVAGLIAFLLAANPQPAPGGAPTSRWAPAVATVAAVIGAAWWLAHRASHGARAALLGSGAGVLFGVQAALTQASVRLIRAGGATALLTSWQPYALCVAAVTGMLLVQSAFESAPMPASYPAVVTGQLLCSIALGVTVLGVAISVSGAHVAAILPSLTAMIAGIVVLTRSHLIAAPHRPRETGGQRSGTGTSHRKAP